MFDRCHRGVLVPLHGHQAPLDSGEAVSVPVELVGDLHGVLKGFY